MGIKERRLADGTVKFEAYSKASGKNKYLKAHDTRALAERAIRRWENRVEEHYELTAAGQTPAPLHSRTVKLAAKEWLKHLDTPGVKGHRSRRKYAQQFRSHVLPVLANTPIGMLTSDGIQEWMIQLTS